jgi:membrane associated rhomboid family serine protease
MRRPPPLSKLPLYPIVGGLALLALGVNLARLKGIQIESIIMDPRIGRGQLWRLLTYVLPHGDALHLIFNLYWLWALGTLVEETFGHVRTFILIVLLAAGSGAAEWAILDGGIGLSGVGYGLWTFCWTMGRRDPRFAEATDQRTNTLFILWFVLCILMTVTHVLPVANIAHAVGAGLGALAGAAIAYPRNRTITITAFAATFLTLLAFATIGRHIVNLSPHRGEAEALLGYEAQTAHDNVQAVRWYQDALRLRQDPSWWFNLGIAYREVERYSDSLEAHRHAHDLAPEQKDYRDAYEAMKLYVAAHASTEPTR